MANDNPPKHPGERSQRRNQGNRISAISHRIAEIGHQISTSIRDLGRQFNTLTDEIQASNHTTDAREKENQNRSFRWVKIGTQASIVLSAFSVITSVLALVILNNQLHTMRIEQRAWIKISHELQPVAENKPLIAEITIKNIGKTPAKRIEGNYRVQKVRKDASPDMVSGNNFNNFIGILNQDTPSTSHVPMLRENTDILNPAILTKSDVAEIESGDVYIAVFGRLTYFDVYGTSHWINFCFWRTPKPGTYTSRGCVEFNNVDDN